VHARLVLVHVPDRARALATMAAALRPGGWLLVEDADTALQPLACLDDSGSAQRRANRLRDAVRELMTRRGTDLRYGRTLPRALREAGLVDVAAAGFFPVGGPGLRPAGGGDHPARARRAARGRLADDAEIDAHLAAINAGRARPDPRAADLDLGTPSRRSSACNRIVEVGAYWHGFGYSRVAELRERLTAVDDR
jgi:hypothetical protein